MLLMIYLFFTHGFWFAQEIVAALTSNCNIIPIIDNFQWPEAEELPDDMRTVCHFNGVRWIHDYQDACVDKLERYFICYTYLIHYMLIVRVLSNQIHARRTRHGRRRSAWQLPWHRNAQHAQHRVNQCTNESTRLPADAQQRLGQGLGASRQQWRRSRVGRQWPPIGLTIYSLEKC